MRASLNSTSGFAGSLSLISTIVICLIQGSLTLACVGKDNISSRPSTTTASSSPGPGTENYPSLAVQAKEVNDALIRKDYNSFVALIYPKVIELAGGRQKMVDTMQNELNQMEAEGVFFLSQTSGEPTQFLHESGNIYAVVPTTLKVKAKDGIFQTEGCMIAVSSDGGASWTFIDASGKDQKELKTLLPGTLDKLKLPADKQPVKISNG